MKCTGEGCEFKRDDPCFYLEGEDCFNLTVQIGNAFREMLDQSEITH
jgi:hypothetical protein